MKTGILIMGCGASLLVAELSLIALGTPLALIAALLTIALTSIVYITTSDLRETWRYRRRVDRDFARRVKARKVEPSPPPRPVSAVTPCAHTEAVPVESSVTGEIHAALCPICGIQLTAEFLGCPHINIIDTPSMDQPPGQAICNDCGTSGWYGHERERIGT